MTRRLMKLLLFGVVSLGMAFPQSRPTGTAYHTVYSSGNVLYGQSSLETSTMQIPPGTTIVHTVTASFSLGVTGGSSTTFKDVQSGGPQDAYDPVATGSIPDDGDNILLSWATHLCRSTRDSVSDERELCSVPALRGHSTKRRPISRDLGTQSYGCRLVRSTANQRPTGGQPGTALGGLLCRGRYLRDGLQFGRTDLRVRHTDQYPLLGVSERERGAVHANGDNRWRLFGYELHRGRREPDEHNQSTRTVSWSETRSAMSLYPASTWAQFAPA